MHIESPSQQVKMNLKETFEFLTDLKNFKKIMPDNLQKFEVINEDSFVFGLSGMPEITLKLKEKVPNSKIVLGAASDKLPFTLTAHITEVDYGTSEVLLNFEGQFNAMMGMMIKSPITNFLGTLSENLGRL